MATEENSLASSKEFDCRNTPALSKRPSFDPSILNNCQAKQKSPFLVIYKVRKFKIELMLLFRFNSADQAKYTLTKSFLLKIPISYRYAHIKLAYYLGSR